MRRGTQSMKRGLVAAFALVAAFVPIASAAEKAATKVTIDSAFVNPGETLFAGDIFSARKACKNDRKVFVFLQRSGDDEKIGSTRSYKGSDQPGYFWVLSEPGQAKEGDYYSKVKPTEKCKGDRSTTIPLER